MTFLSKKGTFALNTSTGSQAVTGVGFQPKIALVWGTNQTVAGTSAALRWSFGAATGAADEFCIMGASDHAADPSNTGRGYKTDATIWLPASGTPTDDCLVDWTSMDADGFTFNVSDAPAAASLMHYLALAGTDLTNAKVGSFVANTSTGNQAVTGVGFQPDVVLFFSVGATTTALQGVNYSSFGAAKSTSARWGFTPTDRDGVGTMESITDLQTAGCLTRVLTAGTRDALGDFVSFDASDGFTVNWSDAPTNAIVIGYIALKGLRSFVGTYTQAASSTTTGYTGVGFQPEVLIAMGNDLTATGISTTADCCLNIGAATTAAQGHMASRSRDGTGAANCGEATDATKFYGGITTGGAQTTHALDSMNADGFTITTVGTTTAAIVPYVALAAAAGGAFTTTPSGALTPAGAAPRKTRKAFNN